MPEDRKINRQGLMANLDQKLAQELTGASNWHEGFRQIGRILRRTTRFDSLVISGVLNQTDTVVNLFSEGKVAEIMPSGLHRPVSDSAVEYLQHHGTTYLEIDRLDTALNPVTEFNQMQQIGMKRFAGAPLMLHGQCVGAVQFASEDADVSNTEWQIDHIAPLLAPIVSLRLTEMVSEQNEANSRTLESVMRSVVKRKQLDRICQEFLDFASRLVGFDGAQVRVHPRSDQQDASNFKTGHFDIDEMGVPLDEARTKLITIGAVSKDAFLFDEAVLAEHSDQELVDTLEEVPSIIIAPLLNDDELVGTLEFYSVNEYAYATEHVSHASHLASLLSSAIVNYQLYADLEAQSEIRKFLAEVARLASSGQNLRDTIGKISEQLEKVIDFQKAVFVLPEETVKISGTQNRAEVHLPGFVSITSDQEFSSSSCKISATDGQSESFCATGSLGGVEGEGFSTGGALHLHRESKEYSLAEMGLLAEFTRHITPALERVVSHQTAIQLIEQKRRAERAEAEALRLSQINDAKREFLATVSHELRTPLTPIGAFVDILTRDSNDNLTDRQRQHLNVIKRNVSWLYILIQDLLDVSRIESGRFNLQLEQFSLDDLVTRLTESMSPLVEGSGHVLETIKPKHDCYVMGDPNRINQVLGNLINNSVKYSPSGTRLRLLVRQTNDHVVFYVRDEGPGIPEDQQSRLFQIFQRADTETTRSVQGTGIGLYISREIVQAHGGEIGLVSEPGSHTTVYFWVPKAAAAQSNGLPEVA